MALGLDVGLGALYMTRRWHLKAGRLRGFSLLHDWSSALAIWCVKKIVTQLGYVSLVTAPV